MPYHKLVSEDAIGVQDNKATDGNALATAYGLAGGGFAVSPGKTALQLLLGSGPVRLWGCCQTRQGLGGIRRKQGTQDLGGIYGRWNIGHTSQNSCSTGVVLGGVYAAHGVHCVCAGKESIDSVRPITADWRGNSRHSSRSPGRRWALPRADVREAIVKVGTVGSYQIMSEIH